MNDETILRIAQEAGITFEPRFGQAWTGNVQMIKFARRLLAAANARYNRLREVERLAGKGERVWIQPDHLAKARKAPYLCRVEPAQREDFVPLYLAPPAQDALDGMVRVQRELIQEFPELNPMNYDEEDVRKLNDWGILVWQAAMNKEPTR